MALQEMSLEWTRVWWDVGTVASLDLQHGTPCATQMTVRIDPEQALAKSPEQHAATWRAREATHAPAPPSRAIAPVAITAEDMRHPAHPRHALFEQTRDAIADAHERWGRPVPDPEQLDRRAAQVVVETRKLGQTEVDKIYLGMPQGHATQTPNYLVQSHGQLVPLWYK